MAQAYESKVIDHLGLVAGMFDELGIGMEIDDRIAQEHEKRKVSVGEAVKAMVLNGLGFVTLGAPRATWYRTFLRTNRPSD